MNDLSRTGRPLLYTEDIQLKIIAFYCQTTPLPGCGRWTFRMAEKWLNNGTSILIEEIEFISHSTIHRILKKHNLSPHRSKYFLQITDPDFFPKMERLISLYLNPLEYLFCFDECPGIQILQRLAPNLQTEETKSRLEEFEYIRNGTMDVFAFLHVKTGKIFAQCKSNHKTKTLVDVFEMQLKTVPQDKPLNYIMDNLSSHASYEICKLVAKYSNINCPSEKDLNTLEKRRKWLQSENKRIVFHFTPFHGSWLNLVEIWFGILNQKCLKESFDSSDAIYNGVYSFAELWNEILAHPFKWNYNGDGLHLKVVTRFIRTLESTSEKLEISFMTKKFLLMTNIIDNYWEKVSKKYWNKLSELLKSNMDNIKKIISDENGPRKKVKAKDALKKLKMILNMKLGK